MALRIVRSFAFQVSLPFARHKSTVPRPPPDPRIKPKLAVLDSKANTGFSSRSDTNPVQTAKKNSGKVPRSISKKCKALHECLEEKLKERAILRASGDPADHAKAKKRKAEAGRILGKISRLVESMNKPLNRIDLHFTTPSMAIDILSKKLEVAFVEHDSLTVVHGRGKHSPNGISLVHEAVLQSLKKNPKYRLTEVNPGATRVQLVT